MLIKAPWTNEQVVALNRWQHYGFAHEFTCPNNHSDKVDNTTSVQLFAHRSGWICPLCDYTQDWAHDFMFEPQTDPLIAAFEANAQRQRSAREMKDAICSGCGKDLGDMIPADATDVLCFKCSEARYDKH